LESIRHLNHKAVDVEVWYRRTGSSIAARYAEIGVPCRAAPEMPRFTTLPRLSRNLYALTHTFIDLHHARSFKAELANTVNQRFDLVHFNHESLFLLARWLRKRTRVPFTLHVRTMPHDTMFARWQARAAAEVMDHVIFITENEQRRMAERGGRWRQATVVYNIVTPFDDEPPIEAVPDDERFKIACLSNFSWYRGVDRLIDIAAELLRIGRNDILFVVAGNMELTRSMPGALGDLGRHGGTLADYAVDRGVADMFLFLGHVDAPEQVLAACAALIKPTRERNPWGRDILEALSIGRPVISFGSYERFVEHGVTGILRERFDVAEIAADIVALMDDPELRKRMGEEGRRRIAELCNGPARAADLLTVWRATLDQM
jgi:glycosyltransferase involved in cell wall biosynthesis